MKKFFSLFVIAIFAIIMVTSCSKTNDETDPTDLPPSGASNDAVLVMRTDLSKAVSAGHMYYSYTDQWGNYNKSDLGEWHIINVYYSWGGNDHSKFKYPIYVDPQMWEQYKAWSFDHSSFKAYRYFGESVDSKIHELAGAIINY